MKKLTFILYLTLFSVLGVNATMCNALISSTWENPSTWSCAQVPAPGDSVCIPVGIIVTVTAVETYVGSPLIITVAGELDFQTGKKLELPCGSIIYGLPGCIINPGNGGGSSDIISICGTNYWIAGMGNAYGPFCWGCPGGLPIVLSSFYANCKDNEVTLNWSTSTEVNNRYFTIERSADGTTWTESARINAAGTTSKTQNYEWSDMEPLPGTSYYCLKQTDFDGHCNIMSTVSSYCNNRATVSLYPNPSNANDNISCAINSNSMQDVTFMVVDYLGRCQSVSTAKVGIGATTQKIETQNLRPGTYILNINFGDGSAPVKKPLIITE